MWGYALLYHFKALGKRVDVMKTIAVQDKYADVLTTFGDLQESVNTVLQRYTIEQVTTKINELRQRNERYQARYGLDYLTFSQRVAEDETFIEHLETNVSKTWEIDLADWEFCYKGIDDWTQKLQEILLT
jgi:hypothetical protein